MKYENMSSLIYDYRELRKMTQKELAKQLGFSTSQFISNIERGLATFPIKKMKKLSKILKISRDLIVNAYIADLTEELKNDVLGI